MIHLEDHLVLTPRLSPTKARMLVMAWWKADEPEPSSPLWVEGRVIGPFCEYAATLSSRIPFRSRSSPHKGSTEAEVGGLVSNLGLKLTSLPERKSEPTRLTVALDILEPCFWEPEHPFCYEVHLELHDDERLLDMRRIVAGIRHLTVEDQELLLNGQSYFVQGTWHSPSVTIAQLEAWHEVDCRAFLVQATTDLCMRTDRWGPMILHLLPPVEADARDQVIRLRNHPSVLLWVIPALITGEYLERYIETIRDHDPSRLIGQLIAADQPIAVGGPIEVVLLPAGHPMIGTSQCNKPYIVVGPSADEVARVHADDFAGEIASFREQVGSPAGLVGLIL